jgi:hypothetical protein
LKLGVLTTELTSTTSTVAAALEAYSQTQTAGISLKYVPSKNTPIDGEYDQLVDDVIGFLELGTVIVKQNTQRESDDNI